VGGALIFWQPLTDTNGELATYYTVYGGHSSLPNSGTATKRVTAKAGLQSFVVFESLNSGETYYFTVGAGNLKGEASTSVDCAPGPVVIGSGPSQSTVSGTVDLGGLALPGTLLVFVTSIGEGGPGNLFGEMISNPTNVQNYAIGCGHSGVQECRGFM